MVKQSADADELERIAMLYIDALLSADDQLVPLADDVVRRHLMLVGPGPYAWQLTSGADIIRDDIRNERLTFKRNVRVSADPRNSSVMILWESGMESASAKAITIVDRIVVRNGRVAELEIVSVPQGQEFGEIPYKGV